MKKLLLSFTFLLMMNIIHGQYLYRVPEEFNIEMIENQAVKTNNSYDFSDINHESILPKGLIININKAEEADLKRLHLNDIQIQNLNNYILKYGELTSIYEMNLIEGYDSALIEQLSPNIRFGLNEEPYPVTYQNLVHKGENTVLLREQRIFERQNHNSGTQPEDSLAKDNPFAGSPDKVLLKYGFNYYDRLRFGITLEKDAGESMKNGFDFMSFHFCYRGSGFIKRVVLGDYNVHFGHGLTMGTGFSPVTDPASSSYIISANKVSPSTAANEGMSLSGTAITFTPLDHINVTVLYSHRRLDGSVIISDTLNNTDGYFPGYYTETIQETGLHRTAKELGNKNAIRQTVYGGNITGSFRWMRIGTTALYTVFDPELSGGKYPYQLNNFAGKGLLNFGADFSINYKSVLLFTEISGSDNGSKAMISGLKAELPGDYGLSIVYRNYGKAYNNFFSSSYSQNAECRNENGLYSSFYINLTEKWLLSAGADIFRFPWIKYRTDAPTTGRELYLRSETGFINGTLLKVRYSYKEKSLNESSDALYLYYPVPLKQHNIRAELKYSPLKSLIFSNRIEFSLHRTVKASSGGFLLYHDIEYFKEGIPVKLNFRYTVFDTDDYNSRIYAYENDVLYAYNVPSFSGKGSRVYAMLRYDTRTHISLWLRYSITAFSDHVTMNTIPLLSRHEIKAQFLFRF